jgi:cold-inducible RNA-binding protein
MNRKLYVGNLTFSTDDQTLNTMFAEAGPVDSVRIVTDQATGRSRGFAFVEMATDEGAKAAIERFNEKEVDGRQLTVNEARPKRTTARAHMVVVAVAVAASPAGS